ncbi:MAG: hypothetical protein KGZ34_04470 [Nitrosarchaeum sp.]|nr:hypothetical protein [Nitrosarchaeum sp.]
MSFLEGGYPLGAGYMMGGERFKKGTHLKGALKRKVVAQLQEGKRKAAKRRATKHKTMSRMPKDMVNYKSLPAWRSLMAELRRKHPEKSLEARQRLAKKHLTGGSFWSDFAHGFKKGFEGTLGVASKVLPLLGLGDEDMEGGRMHHRRRPVHHRRKTMTRGQYAY